MSERKFIIGIVIFTVLILFGGIILIGGSSKETTVEKTAGAKIEVKETNFNFKNIPYHGGNVTHSFPIKNIGIKELTIANLSTSCMCTQVSFKSKNLESPKFGMKGHSSGSNWTGSLKPGEKGEIIVIFDPTAHGPSGIGPVSRFVSFETNDPDKPYVEFSFEGVVIK